ncbi:MAG TPA: DUF2231 domain-containing protein [Vicinamibacterales bacterium]|nr:DUF2231 domain-containing protein [Vicinamibacterales bacterium]
MTDLPLHPVVVHLPLALAFLMPAFALLAAWAAWTGRLRRRTWLGVVALQALLAAGALAAMSTGEREEDRVEPIVGDAALERHEGYAEQFAWGTAVALAIMLVGLAPQSPARRAAVTLAAAATIGVALLGIRTGHAGGQLVYTHGAAAAYATPAKGDVSASRQADAPPAPARIDDEDGDDRN